MWWRIIRGFCLKNVDVGTLRGAWSHNLPCGIRSSRQVKRRRWWTTPAHLPEKEVIRLQAVFWMSVELNQLKHRKNLKSVHLRRWPPAVHEARLYSCHPPPLALWRMLRKALRKVICPPIWLPVKPLDERICCELSSIETWSMIDCLVRLHQQNSIFESTNH